MGDELKPRQKENIYRMRNTQRPNTELLQCGAGVKVGGKYKSNMIHNAICDRGIKGWKLKNLVYWYASGHPRNRLEMHT